MYDRGVRSKGTTGYHKMPSVRIAANTWKKMLTSPMLHGDCILHKEVSNFYTKERVKLPQEDWIYKENVILTPHISWRSIEAQEEIQCKVASNVLSTFIAGKPVYPVNQL